MKKIFTLLITVLMGAAGTAQDTYLFWGDQTTDKFFRSDIDGSNIITLAQNQNQIRRVRVNERDELVYWVEGSTGSLMQANMDGSNPVTLFNVSSMLAVIYVDLINDYIFFTETNDGKIQRCNLDGSNITTVVTGVGNVQGLTTHGDNQNLYWTEYNTGKIKRCDFNGTNISTVFASGNLLMDLDVDPATSNIYFSDRTDDAIYRIDQYGLNQTLIAAVNGDPGALCLDLANEKLYWVESTLDNISESDYNGANRTVIYSSSGQNIGGLDVGKTACSPNAVNSDIINLSPILVASANGAAYQWLDCDNNYAPIIGETSQTFSPSANGNYAVEVAENNCVDTSVCELVANVTVMENSFEFSPIVFPNPSSGIFNLLIGSRIQDYSVYVTDLLGKLIYQSENNKENQLQIDLSDQPRGVYLVKVISGNQTAVLKLLQK